MGLLQDLDANGLVGLTQALAAVEHSSEGTCNLLRAIASGALDLVPTFSPGQLVSLLSSFSALRYHDEAMYAAVARRASQALDALGPGQQTDLLHALALVVCILPSCFAPTFRVHDHSYPS
jgi:hypothetical protein